VAISAKLTSGQLHVSLAENLRDSGGKILGAVCPQPADLFVWVNLATCPKRSTTAAGPSKDQALSRSTTSSPVQTPDSRVGSESS
jgi:hypothetical protein